MSKLIRTLAVPALFAAAAVGLSACGLVHAPKIWALGSAAMLALNLINDLYFTGK